MRKQSGITRQKWTERGGVPRKGFRVDFSLLRDVSASKRTGSEAAVSCHSTMRPLMVLRSYDPLMVNHHDRLEPVTVINFSKFERSFSPFHLFGDCRNGAAFGSSGYKKRRIAVYRLFQIEGIIASDSFRALGSYRKCDALFAAISESRKDDRPIDHWADPKGRRIVRVERGLGRTKLFFDERLEPNFGAHVVDNLSKLYSEFKSRGGED